MQRTLTLALLVTLTGCGGEFEEAQPQPQPQPQPSASASSSTRPDWCLEKDAWCCDLSPACKRQALEGPEAAGHCCLTKGAYLGTWDGADCVPDPRGWCLYGPEEP